MDQLKIDVKFIYNLGDMAFSQIVSVVIVYVGLSNDEGKNMFIEITRDHCQL